MLFFPIFFSGEILDLWRLEKVFISFVSFSFLASACYIINDIKDIETDKLHPKKCLRPVASGNISKKSAFTAFVFLLLLSSYLATTVSYNLLIVNMLYFSNVMLYTFVFKKIPYLDVFFICTGFILRLQAGAVASNTHLSIWLIIMTFLVAAMLGFGKRYEDIIKYPQSRRFIFGYNRSITKLLLLSSSFLAVTTFGFYLYFHNYFSIPLLTVSSVLIINYVYTALIKLKGEPTDFFTFNIFNIFMLLIWAVVFYFRIYR